jgi:hypothetical protein
MKRLWYIIKCFLPNTEQRKFKKWYEDLRDSAIEWNVTTLVENTITMQIRKVCEEVGEVLDAETYEEAINEKATGVSKYLIWSNCKGRCKTGKGFNWVYKEKYNAETI